MPAEVAVSLAVSALIRVLPIILKISSISGPSSTIEEVKTWLIAASASVEDTDGRGDTKVGRNRVKQVRDLAFEIQDAIDDYMYANPEHFHHHKLTIAAHNFAHSVTDLPSVWRLSSRMKAIKRKADTIKKFNEVLVRPSQVASCSTASHESRSFPRIQHHVSVDVESSSEYDHLVLESMKEHKDKLHHLVSSAESMKTIVISVIGDPGSGMSPLIRGVCEMVKKTFKSYTFVTVPRSLERFSTEINNVLPLLKGKKYLLVLDGICTKTECNYVKEKLIHNNEGKNKGSRIIISTCNREVVSYFVSSQNYIYDLNSHPLTRERERERGWELFCKITFRGGKCPDVLDGWSEKIVTKCEQSLDAIVVVGKFLSKTAQTVEDFKKLHDSLVYDPEHTVSLSCHRFFSENYYLLSANHKSLFLYFSIFPGDGFVKRGRLIRLCIGEGFIEENKVKTLHAVADDILDALVQSGLVQVTRSYSQGRARSFRVSNFARGFILSKTEEDRFCTVLESSGTSLVGEKTRRLSLHSCWPSNSQGKDLPLVRTFSVFGVNSSVESMGKELFTKFKLLTVLDLENADLQHFPEAVVNFILLRYLSLRNTKIDSVPKSIKKLLNLVILDLRQTLVTMLPKAILKLHKLLYLFVGCQGINNDKGAQVCPEIGSMTSLQVLSNIKANNKDKNIVKELKNLTELRKLGITELRVEDGEDFCASLKNMKDLLSLSVISAGKDDYLGLDYEMKTLEFLRSLSLGGRLQTIPTWVCKLSSLSKLKLKGSKLQNSPLGALQALPSLKELYLYDAYNGEVLEISAISFLELRILEIEQFSELEVVALKVVVPKLQKLTVKNCGKLSKVCITKKLYSQLEEVLVPPDVVKLLD